MANTCWGLVLMLCVSPILALPSQVLHYGNTSTSPSPYRTSSDPAALTSLPDIIAASTSSTLSSTDSISNATLASPMPTCQGYCGVKYPWLRTVGWEAAIFSTTITHATVILFINTKANITSASTIFNNVSEGYRPTSWPTNSLGTVTTTVKFHRGPNSTFTTVLAYPTVLMDYYGQYEWWGTLATNGVCVTPITTGASTSCTTNPSFVPKVWCYTSFEVSPRPPVDLPSHPIYPQPTATYPSVKIYNRTGVTSTDRFGTMFTALTYYRYGLGAAWFQTEFPDQAALRSCRYTSQTFTETWLETASWLTLTTTSYLDKFASSETPTQTVDQPLNTNQENAKSSQTSERQSQSSAGAQDPSTHRGVTSVSSLAPRPTPASTAEIRPLPSLEVTTAPARITGSAPPTESNPLAGLTSRTIPSPEPGSQNLSNKGPANTVSAPTSETNNVVSLATNAVTAPRFKTQTPDASNVATIAPPSTGTESQHPSLRKPENTAQPTGANSQSAMYSVTVGPSVVTIKVNQTPPGSATEGAVGFVIGTTTVSAGQTVVIQGTPVAVQTSGDGTRVIVGSITGATLTPQVNAPASPPQTVIINDAIVILDSQGQRLVSGQTLVPGSPITLGSGSATRVLVLTTDDAGRSVIVGGSTVVTLMPTTIPASGSIVVNGQTVTANSKSQSVIYGEILAPGLLTTLGSGSSTTALLLTTNSVGSTVPIAGSSTSTLTLMITFRPGSIVVNGQTVTANSIGDYIVSDQILKPGSSIVISSGSLTTVVQLTTNTAGRTVLVVGTSTSTLPLETGSMGLGGYSYSGFGGSTAANTVTESAFQGVATGDKERCQTGSWVAILLLTLSMVLLR